MRKRNNDIGENVMREEIIHHWNNYVIFKNRSAEIREDDLNFEKLNEVRNLELKATQHQEQLFKILRGSAFVIGKDVLIPCENQYVSVSLWKEK
jgi:hypothetical protein